MIARRANTFPDRVNYADRTVDGYKIPKEVWEIFLTLWRVRGSPAYVVALPIVAAILNRALKGSGLSAALDEASPIAKHGLRGLRLIDTNALPAATRTGRPALPETADGPDEISFADLPA